MEKSIFDTTMVPSVLGVLGVVVICCVVERICSSCRRAWRRRNGRDTQGFAQLPAMGAGFEDELHAAKLGGEGSAFEIEMDEGLQASDDDSSDSEVRPIRPATNT